MGDNKLTADSSVVAIDTGGSEEWQDRGDNCPLGVCVQVVFPYLEGGDAIVRWQTKKDSQRQQGPMLPMLRWPSMANSQDTLKSCHP
jgi:hypothetical protein